MSGFAAGETPAGQNEFNADEEASVDGLTRASKVVFSTSLVEPLAWANATLVRDDAVEAVRAMKAQGSGVLSTIGSISLCRSLLGAGLVDRFRVVMFPVITGATGAERIYDGYPDVALEMIDNRTFDGRIQLVEYRPSVLEHHRSTRPRESTGELGAAKPTCSSVRRARPGRHAAQASCHARRTSLTRWDSHAAIWDVVVNAQRPATRSVSTPQSPVRSWPSSVAHPGAGIRRPAAMKAAPMAA